MKLIIVILVGCASLFLSGCAEERIVEAVKVVSVSDNEAWEEPDSVTVVEFPDGTRRWRHGDWGDVGDEFSARKYRMNNWR